MLLLTIVRIVDNGELPPPKVLYNIRVGLGQYGLGRVEVKGHLVVGLLGLNALVRYVELYVRNAGTIAHQGHNVCKKRVEVCSLNR